MAKAHLAFGKVSLKKGIFQNKLQKNPLKVARI
jgi:hypothetical protein